jgi:hypothetical protein
MGNAEALGLGDDAPNPAPASVSHVHRDSQTTLCSGRSSSGSLVKFAAMRRERWRQSGATQQHVRNQGVVSTSRRNTLS